MYYSCKKYSDMQVPKLKLIFGDVLQEYLGHKIRNSIIREKWR